mmetsp:Transcript_127362/g.291224  ORF Transcript_127362/g.291224 Transcript_127362/m.291224 type:complete len:124 (-) Transcript_127362:38-409(-)
MVTRVRVFSCPCSPNNFLHKMQTQKFRFRPHRKHLLCCVEILLGPRSFENINSSPLCGGGALEEEAAAHRMLLSPNGCLLCCKIFSWGRDDDALGCLKAYIRRKPNLELASSTQIDRANRAIT